MKCGIVQAKETRNWK